ncbi:hypothetical protein [Mycolicibacterium fluoranthenivorans]|nr:hypothetical protein [Mycolicibacterium fluoranthenivorans]
MTASQLLTGAAAWIDGHGWIQNTYYEPGTLAACAIGALHFASQDRYGRDGQARRAAIAEAAGSLAQIAEELNGRPLDGATAQEQVIAWNNSGVIDQADAVVWLQKSAARAAEMVR